MMLITLKGVIREMEHVIVSLVTKANTAQKNVQRGPTVRTVCENAAALGLVITCMAHVISCVLQGWLDQTASKYVPTVRLVSDAISGVNVVME